jgi:hypothetical protein
MSVWKHIFFLITLKINLYWILLKKNWKYFFTLSRKRQRHDFIRYTENISHCLSRHDEAVIATAMSSFSIHSHLSFTLNSWGLLWFVVERQKAFAMIFDMHGTPYGISRHV